MVHTYLMFSLTIWKSIETLFQYADDTTIVIPVWANSPCRTDLMDQFFMRSRENSVLCNRCKCRELIFRIIGYNENMALVHNIPQSTELPILGVTFQEN